MRDQKILLVDDALEVHLLVQSALGKMYSLKCVTSAEAAAEELKATHYSLLILDVGLPGEDGFKFCANLRADARYRELPIVFLTGKGQTRDKVLGFSLGADDYVVKPIDVPEFQARIEAKMRRLQSTLEDKNNFSKDVFRISLAEQKAFIEQSNGSEDLGLSTIEFKLLYYFLRHEDHVLSRNQILDEVWGATHVTDRVVDTYVYSLRKKLGDLGKMIQSVPRVGYRLSFSEKTKAA